MSKNRFSARTDANEADIVKALRKMGYSVQTRMDDLLIGHENKNFWVELKDPKHVGKDGKIRESAKKEGQKILEKEWRGNYNIVSSLEEILEIINGSNKSLGIALAKEMNE